MSKPSNALAKALWFAQFVWGAVFGVALTVLVHALR